MQGDYYLGSDVSAKWYGKLASKLNLDPSKNVTKKQFEALLSGKHPFTGKKLVQRMRKDRRPGIDFTFSVPKSVSLVYAINQDERIVKVLEEAVRETMERDIEPLMHRRVRDGANVKTTNRKQTGNLIYCPFLHKTSRPVNGSVDPHLHVHSFAINLTTDEDRFFAAEFAEAMRQLPSLQAKFDARLAQKLESQLSYEVEKVTFKQSNRIKTGFEIKGIERATIEKFSQRTAQIEKQAALDGIHDPSAKSKLGKKTRERKGTELPLEKLREEWRARLTPKERKAFAALRAGAIGVKPRSIDQNVAIAVDFALQHHLYRQSTVELHQVVGTALDQGLTLSPEQVEDALKRSDVIARSRTVDGAQRKFVTTTEVLEAESSMIAFARDGRGTRYIMATEDHAFKRDWLNDQQKAAVNHVLQSRDTVTGVTGGAGTGKTALMQEAVEGIQKHNKQVFTFAPSTGAKEVLVEEGFAEAQTVEHLIRNTKLQETIKADDVIWIDEAGLLDVRSMRGVFEVANQQQARVVLSGDTRQHSSPRPGEALRLLESEAGLNVVRIHKIQRQKGQYKKAVELVSRGNEIVDQSKQTTGLLAGFDLLDRMGKIKEIGDEARLDVLAQNYISNFKKNKSTLVIAPTRIEGQAITEEIRNRLREAGAIGEKNRQIRQLQSLYFSEAQKSDNASYQTGMVVQFHQNVKGGFKRGERYRVQISDQTGILLSPERGNGKAKPLPYSNPDRFEVYGETSLPITVGDKLRFSLGGKAADGKRRFSNGRLDEIKSFDRRGNLVLKSGMTIDRDFGHLDHGYVLTSHGSQGKTTKLSIAAMGSDSLPAINAKQFYVTVSRGSEDVAIYVDSKAKVRRAIQDAGQQLSATELVKNTQASKQNVVMQQQHSQRAFLDRVRQWWRNRADWSARRLSKKKLGLGKHPSPSVAR